MYTCVAYTDILKGINTAESIGIHLHTCLLIIHKFRPEYTASRHQHRIMKLPVMNASHQETTRHKTSHHETTRHQTWHHETSRHETTRHKTSRHETTRHETSRHETTRHKTSRHETSYLETTHHQSP